MKPKNKNKNPFRNMNKEIPKVYLETERSKSKKNVLLLPEDKKQFYFLLFFFFAPKHFNEHLLPYYMWIQTSAEKYYNKKFWQITIPWFTCFLYFLFYFYFFKSKKKYQHWQMEIKQEYPFCCLFLLSRHRRDIDFLYIYFHKNVSTQMLVYKQLQTIREMKNSDRQTTIPWCIFLSVLLFLLSIIRIFCDTSAASQHVFLLINPHTLTTFLHQKEAVLFTAPPPLGLTIVSVHTYVRSYCKRQKSVQLKWQTSGLFYTNKETNHGKKKKKHWLHPQTEEPINK